jgi:hypothetical protein
LAAAFLKIAHSQNKVAVVLNFAAACSTIYFQSWEGAKAECPFVLKLLMLVYQEYQKSNYLLELIVRRTLQSISDVLKNAKTSPYLDHYDQHELVQAENDLESIHQLIPVDLDVNKENSIEIISEEQDFLDSVISPKYVLPMSIKEKIEDQHLEGCFSDLSFITISENKFALVNNNYGLLGIFPKILKKDGEDNDCEEINITRLLSPYLSSRNKETQIACFKVLFVPSVLKELSSRFGREILDIPIPAQLAFINFLNGQDYAMINRVEKAIKQQPDIRAEILTSFLASNGDQDMGEQILAYYVTLRCFILKAVIN